MTDDYNSDAEREIALANTRHLDHLRSFVASIFALPGVQEAVYDVEANQLADAIEQLGEEGRL